MAFDGTEGAMITLNEAVQFTANHRNSMTEGDVISHYFGRRILEQILAQPGCMGIRMYYGKDENGVKNLVLVGADQSKSDITNGLIADRSVVCPPDCPTKNGLNSTLNP